MLLTCSKHIANTKSTCSQYGSYQVTNSTSLPSGSKLSWSTSWTASSVASKVCSLHVSPLSERKMTISLSLPLKAAKCGTSMMTGLKMGQQSELAWTVSLAQAYPKNLAPEGPSSKTLEAIASPSIKGGGWINLSFLRYRHVILMGMGAFLGGMITLTPECLHPLMAPPRASTMKLTRNLNTKKC